MDKILIDQFSEAARKATAAAAGGQPLEGHYGEFPRGAWGIFTGTLARELGPDWGLMHIPPPTRDLLYKAIHLPTRTSVSAVIRLGEHEGTGIYELRAIGNP
jgi:hypothetical protein